MKFKTLFMSDHDLLLFFNMSTKQKVLSFQKVGQKRKIVIKSNLPLSHSPDCKMFPFKKGSKKHLVIALKSIAVVILKIDFRVF